ncbi:peptidoglycan-associated lipoprotein Pal [Desulfococcus sp.]|uniref:peptidoglycan-associated lipoprotein Pal n=1 Tax=Desulfococcus sp. TaxID=2025834 RepID=UPI00359387B5
MRGKKWIIAALILIIPGLFMTTSCSKKMVKSDGMTMAGDGGQGTGAGGDGQGAIGEDGLTPEQRAAKEQFLNEHIYFAFDRSDLSAEAQATLGRKAEYLQENTGLNVTIEGHCDERGTNEYNLALGDRRALSVKAYLENLGVSGSRMSPVSYGEERPLDPGHTEEAWSQNRRAQFIFE